ncbi:hypothetical protein [Streptomyces sp. MMBL 11-1]|uniref:hypothetical protein n=1 Tax=Streptomyces sp. MMBL 11-1 TaxID=3026420 RepID=UPI00235F6B78|nr:hypothetical protein [Streptomyces sp. MMBL 11-1]
MAVLELLEAIEAVDWGSLPGPAGLYEPARAATGLRALATAAGLVRAADAGSLLAGGGLGHDHSGAVFPAAVAAAPLLLAVVRHGHPAAGATALGLLDDALAFAVRDQYTRVATPYAEAAPICCALADHLRGGSSLLAARGREGKRLLADAAGHWRFDAQEVIAEGDGIAVFGTLAGRFPDGCQAAELHRADRVVALERVILLHPPEAGVSPDASLRVDGVRSDELVPPAVLFPARCGPGALARRAL